MSTKQKLSEEMYEYCRRLKLWSIDGPLYHFIDTVRTLEAERDALRRENARLVKEIISMDEKLEQALLDRDTLKAETLRLAKERDQWKVRVECLTDPNRDVCEHGADQWTYCVPCEAPYVDDVCIRLTTERDAAIKQRDEAVYEARYMREQMARSEAMHPELWYASNERAMLISERDSYATEAREARREALEWALDRCLTFGLPVAGNERIRAELARLDAEDAEDAEGDE